MAIDRLQEKIRKTKNPTVVVFEAFPGIIPPAILEQERSVAAAYCRFASELLTALQGVVGALRFGFGSFALLGEGGLQSLSALVHKAKDLGYYVILDLPELLSAMAAENAVDMLLREDTAYPCDGVVVGAYLGSDILKPFSKWCKQGKTLFPVVRTGNKSATELQDLLTGGRLVHTAAADIVNRLGEASLGRSGYSNIGVLAAASSADSLRGLRAKYKRLFLLLDGYDYPNANAKNCSYAFDNLGHGAAACAGISVTGAWKECQSDDYAGCAVEAAERAKKNLTRYITVL